MSVHSVSIEPSIRLDLKKVNDINIEKYLFFINQNILNKILRI